MGDERDRFSGGDAGTDQDTDDQRRLRNTVLEEIEAVMHKHSVGGAVFISSRDSGAWRMVLPRWSSVLQFDNNTGGLRVRGSVRTPEQHALFNSTLFYVAAIRDMASQCGRMFSDIYSCVEAALPPNSIEHKTFRGFGVGRSGD